MVRQLARRSSCPASSSPSWRPGRLPRRGVRTAPSARWPGSPPPASSPPAPSPCCSGCSSVAAARCRSCGSAKAATAGFNQMVALDKLRPLLHGPLLRRGHRHHHALGCATWTASRPRAASSTAAAAGRHRGMIGMAMATDIIDLLRVVRAHVAAHLRLAGYLRGDGAVGRGRDQVLRQRRLRLGHPRSSAWRCSTGSPARRTTSASPRGCGTSTAATALLAVALVLVAAGFGFKVSAVPFHGWAPDVYEGAPTPVTAFMAVGVKAGAFAGFAALLHVAAAAGAGRLWSNILIVLAVLTMVVGNVLALPQRNLKRMLAYSSIAHAGYLLLGVIAAGEPAATARRQRGPLLPGRLRVHEPGRLRRARLDPQPASVRLHARRDRRAGPHACRGRRSPWRCS